MARISMKFIAEKAGVSIATVSRVLGDNPSVNPELRRRVLHVVQEYQYEPNSNARSLHTKRTDLLALIIPDISNPFFPSIAKAAEEVATLHGFHMLLCNTDSKVTKEKAYASLARRHQVDGMIVLPATAETQHLSSITRLGVPLLTLDRSASGLPCVRTDNEHGGYLAARHLLACGHTRIACIAASWDPKVSGYRRALVEAGVTPDPALFVESTDFPTRDPGFEGTKKLLSLPYPPTAIMCASDVVAAGVYMALEDANLRIPDDVAVIGYDNTILAATMRPGLTSVAQPTQEMGRLAAQMIVDAIEGRAVLQPEIVMLEPRLVVRDSTTPVRSESRSTAI